MHVTSFKGKIHCYHDREQHKSFLHHFIIIDWPTVVPSEMQSATHLCPSATDLRP